MNILAALKIILAKASIDDLFSAAAADIVSKQFIEELERDANRASGLEAEEIGELIDLYDKYASPRSPLVKRIGQSAAKSFESQARSKGLNSDETMDAATAAIQKVYQSKLWKKFNIDDGPEAFAKFFNILMRNQARQHVTDILRHRGRMKTMPGKQDDEGNESDFFDNQEAPEEFGVEHKDILSVLRRSLVRHFKKDWQIAMIDRLLDLLSSGVSDVNWSRQVADPIAREFGLPKGTVRYQGAQMKKTIARIFEEEFGRTPGVLASERFASASVVERVTYSEYLRRVADWVLPSNPVCRTILLS